MVETELAQIHQHPQRLLDERVGFGFRLRVGLRVAAEILDKFFPLAVGRHPREHREEHPVHAFFQRLGRREDCVGEVAFFAAEKRADVAAVVEKQMLAEAALEVALAVRRLAEVAEKIIGRRAVAAVFHGIVTARDAQCGHDFLGGHRADARALEVHPEILERDQEFRAASSAVNDAFHDMPKAERELMQKRFIKAMGGAWRAKPKKATPTFPVFISLKL